MAMTLDQQSETRPPVYGLIMAGGGARAAYQVGVLKAIAESRDLPDTSQAALKEAAQMFKKEHEEFFVTK